MSKTQKQDQAVKFDWLDEFLDSTQATLGRMDFKTLQPCSHQHFLPLIAKAWLPWFERIVDEREKRQMPWSEAGRAFSPVLAREHLIFTLEDLKAARWPLEKRLKIVDFFSRLIREGIPSDPYATDGTARMHSASQVKQMLGKEYREATPALARALGRLYNAMYNLSAALYLDFFMGIGAVNYGPYPLEKSRSLFLKTAPDLKPVNLWPHAASIPARRIELFQIYRNAAVSVDLISCHVQYRGDAITGLEKWRLEVDGKSYATQDQVDALTQALAWAAKDQWQHLLQLSPEKIIEKGIRVRCYAFKDLCDALGLDWRPTPALLKAADGKTLQDGWDTWKHPKAAAAQKAYWRKIWDPRIDFYP